MVEAVVIESIALEALILDFGGVLYPIDYDAPVRAFEALGFRDFASFYHQAAQHHWFDDLEVGDLDESQFLDELRSHCAAGTTQEAVRDAWNSILLRMPKEHLNWVEELSGHTRLFLFSNTNAIHARAFETRLEEDGLLSPFRAAFEAIHYSHEFKARKPHPESFKALCLQHGLTPKRTGFVDDSLHHVHGAISAGLRGLHYHPDQGVALPEALRNAGWVFS